MDDPADLVDHVRAHRDDIAARQVYADMLEDLGEADLAEMVRLGAELKALAPGHRGRGDLEARYFALRGAEAQRGPARPTAPGSFVRWLWMDGPYSGGPLDQLTLA